MVGSCQKRWTELSGNGRRRFCETCQTHVHAIEQYSPEEWASIWRERTGPICGLLCGESPIEPRSRRAVLVGALLTAVAPLMAQSGRVRVRVMDSTDHPLSQANVSILDARGDAIRTAVTDDAGEVALGDLPLGDCRIKAESPGFSTWRRTVTLRDGDELKVNAGLLLGSIGTTVEIAKPEDRGKASSSTSPAQPPASEPRKKKRHWWQIF